MSRIQFVRQMLPRICKDFYEMEIYHNPTGAATFDPTLTTSVSTTVIWQTEAGTTVTTGTNHALSYTPTAGPKVCKVTVLEGLRAVAGIDCNTDAITAIKNLQKCSNLITFYPQTNAEYRVVLSQIPSVRVIQTEVVAIGSLSSLNRLATHVYLYSLAIRYTLIGSLSDLPGGTLQAGWFYKQYGIAPGTIAHLVAIRDLRIYSMGWSAAQNTDVLLSAWGARANYTYASDIQLRIGTPTGTPGTEPPAAGESNADWSWNAGASRHDPLTGYAVIADLQNDFYSEGFKGWTVTIL